MSIPKELSQIKLPASNSHKGQNGRLLIIGGSKLFHAASLWALKVASRIVDLVHYASVPENNQIVYDLKVEFRDGIVIARSDIETYIEEDDCILIGPGMTRDNETKELTDRLLQKYKHKQWVIDAGALQMMDLALIPRNAILTPHHREFTDLLMKSQEAKNNNDGGAKRLADQVQQFARQYQCIVLVKGEIDLVSNSGEKYQEIVGGNAGMTKGGTGDVLAGLIAGLACKNDPFVATVAGAFFNKKAGDALFKKFSYFYNASDLADEIPKVMKEALVSD